MLSCGSLWIVSLPSGAMCWSLVCAWGIFWLHSPVFCCDGVCHVTEIVTPNISQFMSMYMQTPEHLNALVEHMTCSYPKWYQESYLCR